MIDADAVATEAANFWVAKLLTTGIVAGADRLRQLLHGKADPLPEDPDVLAALLTERAVQDPEWAVEVAQALSSATDRVEPEPLPPAPLGAFFDRDGVRGAMPSTGIRVFAGQYGIGKTALTRQLVHDLRDRFPTPAYIDLDHERRGDLLAFADIQQKILRQLGIGGIDATAVGIREQYRRVTARNAFLLVLENALSVTEIEPLLPSSPAGLVLVTTRKLGDDFRLRFNDGACLELAGLDPAGAWELLAAGCGPDMLRAEPAATESLLALCDFLPFAIAQVGVTLRRRSGEVQPVADLLTELGDSGVHDVGGLIEDCLTRSFALLSTHAVSGCLLLADHPGGVFTVDSAAALLGRSRAETRAVLNELGDIGFLTVVEPGRQRLHHLCRRYAMGLDQADEVDRDAAFSRILAYYCDRAVGADLTCDEVAPGRVGPPRLRRYARRPVARLSSKREAIRWLDSERTVLAELVRQAHQRGLHEEVCQLCGVLELLLLHRGRHRLFAEANEWGIRSASVLGRRELQARVHAMQGRVHTQLHEFDEAQRELTTAGQLLSEVDDPQSESSVLEFRSRLAEELAERSAQPDYSAAVALMSSALEIDRRIGDARARGLHARMSANLFAKIGETTMALSLLAEALDNTTDDRNLSRVHTARAKVRVVLGDLGAARSDVTEARSLAEREGATQYDLELTDIEAEIAFRAGDYGVARSRWGMLVERCHAAGHPKARVFLAKLNRLPRP